MRLRHEDGSAVEAKWFKGRRQGWVVVAGATGVPMGFYDRIAKYLSDDQGWNVLTFDYRGIGRSLEGSLRGSKIVYQDWAEDLRLVVRWASERGPICVVGHSFGGHAFGMTDVHTYTLGLYTFATGAGWHGYMPRGEKLKIWAMWNLVFPPIVAVMGYLPGKGLGFGESLPAGVYRDWRRWCASKDYFFSDPKADYEARFQAVRVPVVGMNSTDDLWALPQSARAFLSRYPHVEMKSVHPFEIDVRAIGHLDYVRPRCAKLWEGMRDWLDERFAAWPAGSGMSYLSPMGDSRAPNCHACAHDER